MSDPEDQITDHFMNRGDPIYPCEGYVKNHYQVPVISYLVHIIQLTALPCAKLVIPKTLPRISVVVVS